MASPEAPDAPPPEDLELGFKMLAEARQLAETFPTVEVLNALMGQLPTFAVWAEVAGNKARTEGLQDIALLADQVRTLVNAAGTLAMKAESRLSGRKIFPPRVTAEQENAAANKMIKATERYLWLYNSGVPPQYWSKTEEASVIVQETFDLVRRLPPGQEGMKYADAVLWKVGQWADLFRDSMPLLPMTTPPLAYWLLTSANPTPQAYRAALARAGVAMDSCATGPQSENAVRRALCIVFQELGAPSKDANNWFRPQPDEVEKTVRVEKRSRKTRA